ncbi:MAG: branched-chain amino acid ABC transporter permease [Chloroflexota bacterium]
MLALKTILVNVQSWGAARSWGLVVTIVLPALILPFFVRSYTLSLVIEVLIFAIFAMSLDLLLGYTGLVSLGHAAFLGLGAYITAYLTSTHDPALGLTTNLVMTLPLVILGTGLAALIIGLFALRTSGIYFLMITLAFAQMLYSVAIRWSRVTGGSDGLAGVLPPSIGVGSLSYVFETRSSFYYLALALFLGCWWGLHHLVNSPFGWVLRGIRENEPRMLALGYNTLPYKLVAFMMAGMLAGLAGMLLAHFFRHAAPDNLYWTMSGQVMIMLIVGGSGTLIGPVMGALVVRILPYLVSDYTDRWQTVIGLLFMLIVLFAPGGIMGWRRRQRNNPV